METVQGTVIRIMFSSEDTGYKVLRTRTKNDHTLIITGEFGPEIIPESVADFHGDYKSHPKYGPQFRAYSYHVVHNAEELGSIKLFIDNIAPNFGSERSEAIISHFGKDIIDILDHHPQRLVEVTGIGKVLAQTLQEAWEENKEKWDIERSVYSLRSFLHSMGIKERRVKRILAHFGGQGMLAEEKIRDNPYLLSEIEGFGFTSADFVARNLGIPESDPRRLKFFIYHLLRIICPSNGHLYLEINDLPKIINTYCRENGTHFLDIERIKSSDIDSIIKQLIKEEKVIIDGNSLYAPKQFKYEKDSAELLAGIIKEPSDLIFLNTESVEDHITRFEKENGIILSSEQKRALYYFAERKVFIITGAPGTGKTMTLRVIVDLAIRMGFRLTCLAPTGVSAKKLSSVISFDAYTIHRRLGFRGDHWTYNSLEPYDTDIIILDETSMINQEVFYRLLSALKKRTHLILVGDKDQLPSVGAGNVLKELIRCRSVPTIYLDQIFRQDEASDIIKAAHKINHGDTDLTLFKQDPKADIFFMREQSPERIEEIIIALAQRFKDERRLFQIITPRRTGPLGAAALNEILQKALNPPAPHLKEMNCKDFILRVGDRAIVVKNDYENDVYNGDIGKVINIYSGKVCIKIDNRLIEFTVEEIGEKIRLGYSLTVHKCIPGNSYITTPGGLKKIEDIKKGDYVITIKGKRRVTWSGFCGKKPAYEIRTRTGIILRSSVDHKYLSADNTGVCFKKAQDLKRGEFLSIPIRMIKGENQPINWKDAGNNRVHIHLPKNLTPDLSWLLGIIIGDGCYTDKNDGTVEIAGRTKIPLLNEIQRIVESFGIKVNNRYKNNKVYSKYFVSKNFRDWLRIIGIGYTIARHKRVPELMFQATISCRRAFIGGLFDSDGCVDKRPQLRYTTSSKDLAGDIQKILSSLGIISFVSSQSEFHHKVLISGPDFERFKETIPLKHQKKHHRLHLKRATTKTNHYEIPYGKPLCVEFQSAVEDFTGISLHKMDKKLHSKIRQIIRGVNKLRINVVHEMMNFFHRYSMEPLVSVRRIEEEKILYDEIKSIHACTEKEEMYDIEVESDHHYITQGAVCHNCQGSEYSYIILPFINQFGKNMLQRNLLYTALTRAKQKVIVLGHGSALEKAINNASVSKRNTKLGERLIQCLLQKKKVSSPTLPSEQPNSVDVKKEKELSWSEVAKFFPTVFAEN